MEVIWMYLSWFFLGSSILSTAMAFYFKNGLDAKQKEVQEKDAKLGNIETQLSEMKTAMVAFNEGRGAILAELSTVTKETEKVNDALHKFGIGEKVNKVKNDDLDNSSPEVLAEIINTLARYSKRDKSRNIDRY